MDELLKNGKDIFEENLSNPNYVMNKIDSCYNSFKIYQSSKGTFSDEGLNLLSNVS
jgi:hypothetical protein